MICVYCDEETGDEFDEHAECVELSIAEEAARREEEERAGLAPD